MCGIIGYVGPKECAPILVEGLRRLEYRGYDSAGLALQTPPHASGKPGSIEVVRAVGKLANLEAALRGSPLAGTTGIGHTRWATHGRVSQQNAHPHVAGSVAVVHNGIIENHVALRRELEARGVRFASDTDTEIVAHLIDEVLRAGETSFVEAVRAALQRIRGSYGIAVVSSQFPGEIIAAKADSPLVLGLGDGEMLCASDVPALLAHTRDVIFLHDGEIAALTRRGAVITTLDGAPVARAARRIDWSPTQAEKGGFKHFMLKEIHEQPRAVEDTLRGRVDLTEGDVIGEEMGVSAELAKKIDRVYFVACGTSAHAAIAGRYWVEQIARLPAVVEIGSEVRYRDPVFTERDLVVAVSQSGETLDTLAALKAAKAKGATVLAVANVIDSAIPGRATARFTRTRGRRSALLRRSASRRSSSRCSSSPCISGGGAACSAPKGRGASWRPSRALRSKCARSSRLRRTCAISRRSTCAWRTCSFSDGAWATRLPSKAPSS